MSIRACIAVLLLLSACATTAPSPRASVARSPRLANLQRAAGLPWRDGGQCVVQEAAHPWAVVVERCFHALDTRKVRFRDIEKRCPVASVDAASLERMVGICLLTQPEIIVGAVVVIGVVVVAVAIAEDLGKYDWSRLLPEDAAPVSETRPVTQEPVSERRPKPESSSSGQGRPPPVSIAPPGQERSTDCTPRPVPHLGGDALHNQCADRVPQNGFPGSDVLVSGKRFDALQPHARVLWEIKTDNFDTFSAFLQRTVADKQAVELRRELDLARACGFDFRVGVRSAAHKAALERLDETLKIVVMDWC